MISQSQLITLCTLPQENVEKVSKYYQVEELAAIHKDIHSIATGLQYCTNAQTELKLILNWKTNKPIIRSQAAVIEVYFILLLKESSFLNTISLPVSIL